MPPKKKAGASAKGSKRTRIIDRGFLVSAALEQRATKTAQPEKPIWEQANLGAWIYLSRPTRKKVFHRGKKIAWFVCAVLRRLNSPKIFAVLFSSFQRPLLAWPLLFVCCALYTCFLAESIFLPLHHLSFRCTRRYYKRCEGNSRGENRPNYWFRKVILMLMRCTFSASQFQKIFN